MVPMFYKNRTWTYAHHWIFNKKTTKMITKILPKYLIFKDGHQMVNTNSDFMQLISKQVSKWCFSLQFFRSINNFIINSHDMFIT